MSCCRCSWAAVAASSDNRSMRAESLSIFLRQDDNVVGSVSESLSRLRLNETHSMTGQRRSLRRSASKTVAGRGHTYSYAEAWSWVPQKNEYTTTLTRHRNFY